MKKIKNRMAQTFPAGEARCFSRSASEGLDAWAAKATKADCKKIKHEYKLSFKYQCMTIRCEANQPTFLGELKRHAYRVSAVLKLQGGNGGGREVLIGVPSSLSEWREK